jgi:hypothetical protein
MGFLEKGHDSFEEPALNQFVNAKYYPAVKYGIILLKSA